MPCLCVILPGLVPEELSDELDEDDLLPILLFLYSYYKVLFSLINDSISSILLPLYFTNLFTQFLTLDIIARPHAVFHGLLSPTRKSILFVFSSSHSLETKNEVCVQDISIAYLRNPCK